MSGFDNEDDIRRPTSGDPGGHDAQKRVDTYFDSSVSYWDDVYRDDDLQGRIYRQRQALVLAYVDAANLQPDSRVLEIGCGAGHLTMQLARRGLRVNAVDTSQAMVEAATGRALESGLRGRVMVGLADAHSLPFRSDRFDLVVAVGVIPWLHSPPQAIREMTRVLRDGGQMIVTADNRARLNSFIDPRSMLAQSPLKLLYHALRKRRGLAMSRMDSPRRIDRLLRQHGLRRLAGKTVGFGPLSLLGQPLFEGPLGLRINDRLQYLADRGTPGLKWMGWHYVVRVGKP
jgi:ubiquinone/menaquinone biosynthesis C-methylase UbiE